jgi:hypothetical protein
MIWFSLLKDQPDNASSSIDTADEGRKSMRKLLIRDIRLNAHHACALSLTGKPRFGAELYVGVEIGFKAIAGN